MKIPITAPLRELVATLGRVPSTVEAAADMAVRRSSCPTCGAPIGRLDPWCRPCHARVAAAEREAAIQAVVPSAYAVAFGTPELAAGSRDERAVARVRGLVASPPRVVLLWGPTQAGKSTLVGAFVRAMLSGPFEHAEAMWTRAPRLASAREEHGLGEGEPPALARAKRAELLVLDDLGLELGMRGAGDVSEAVREHLEHEGLLVVTTMLPPASEDRGARTLRTEYEPHISGRLCGARAEVVAVRRVV